MKKRRSQVFRPSAEAIEGRLLTTVLPLAPGAGVTAAAARFQMRFGLNAPPRMAPIRGGLPPSMPLGPHRGGLGPWRAPSTADYMNWGVITIWNKSSAPVTFAASASTYDFGRFQNFTLRPGGYQAFYAPFGGPFNSAPSFYVTFDPIQRTNTIQIDDMNVVNESPRWIPRVGTEGRPYAIVNTVGALNLIPMS